MGSQKNLMLPQLLVTNFAVVLLVVFFHYASGVLPFRASSFLTVLLKGVNGIIHYFFVLSGFVLTLNYYNDRPIDTKKYFVSRFARIYPVYFLALLFWIVSHLVKGLDLQEVINITLTLLLIQSWVPGYSLTYNYPTWFVSVLIFFYLIFPLVINHVNKNRGKRIYLAAAVLWLLGATLIFLFHNKPDFIKTHIDLLNVTLFHPLFMYSNAFIVGIAGGVFIVRNQDLKCHFSVPLLMVALSPLMLWLVIREGTWATGGRLFYPNGLLSPIYLMFIMGLALDRTALSRCLSSRVFITLGSISYSVYILHVPLRLIMQKALAIDIMQTELYFYSYLGVLLVSSLAVYMLYEKPARRRILALFNNTSEQ